MQDEVQSLVQKAKFTKKELDRAEELEKAFARENIANRERVRAAATPAPLLPFPLPCNPASYFNRFIHVLALCLPSTPCCVCSAVGGVMGFQPADFWGCVVREKGRRGSM